MSGDCSICLFFTTIAELPVFSRHRKHCDPARLSLQWREVARNKGEKSALQVYVSFVFSLISSSEEISRCQEMIQKLQSVLESERENCGLVSEQRLRLQQENEQLRKEMEDLRKIALEAQKKAKLKVLSDESELNTCLWKPKYREYVGA